MIGRGRSHWVLSGKANSSILPLKLSVKSEILNICCIFSSETKQNLFLHLFKYHFHLGHSKNPN